MGLLDGKVAVVTGGARGLGFGMAGRFLEEGAKVVLGDVLVGEGEEAAAALGAAASFERCDVTVEADVADLVASAVARHGRLDVMCNNAGAIGARGSILDIAAEDWDATMALLLRGAFFGMKHAGAVMVEQGSGSIVSTASVAALEPGNGPHVYGTAKAALVHLTKRAALELGERGVRVNAICPGGVATNMVLGLFGAGDANADQVEQIEHMMAFRPPMGRAGTVDDVSAVAAWLASDEASFVTGQAIAVDGGESVGMKWSLQVVK